ncbi:M3 family metallopeptidase [Acrocarpospora sp. B8E8]|uniref:M3 family metallopeptidase n=1 Tax=Acrocarpospora sp. B8E8 TaxID=3153572 RepID=UPI00325CB936
MHATFYGELIAGSLEDLMAKVEQMIDQATDEFGAIISPEADSSELLGLYDDMRGKLQDVAYVANVIQVVHPDQEMRDAGREAEQRLNNAILSIDLNPELYQALTRSTLPEQDSVARHYLGRVLRDFRRAGVNREAEVRARIQLLREELVGCEQEFKGAIRSDSRAAVFPLSELAGLPADFLRSRTVDGTETARITTDHPDFFPVMTYCHNSAVRETMWRLFRQRGFPANIENLNNLLKCRHELATLLGYPNWAAYVTEDKMIGSADAVREFMDEVTAATEERTARDHALLLAHKRRSEPGADSVEPWDVSYLENEVRLNELRLDSQEIRAYFEYDGVRERITTFFGGLAGVEFKVVDDLELWHPDVDCYEVLQAGRLVGRVYLDMHPRPNKYQHAALFFMGSGKAGLRIPECALVCNFPQPGEEPALLLLSEARTFLHEFGHVLHYLLAGGGRWAGLNGITTEWDFAETPSQLLEEWLADRGTLASIAKHYQDGTEIPPEMAEKLFDALEVSRGITTSKNLFFAALSFHLHAKDPAQIDPTALEREMYEKYTPHKYVEETWAYLSLDHLAGYSAIVYTYIWSQVIAKDLFTAFAGADLSDSQLFRRYAETILARGSAAPAAELVRDFLGRPFQFDAFKEWLDR